MKSDNPTIDTLVVITNRRLLKGDMSLATYGVALSRAVEIMQKYGKYCINTIEKSSLLCNIHSSYTSTVSGNLDSNRLHKERVDSVKADSWMRNHSSLYTLCRDTDLPFEEYLQLCDTIGSTVVYHGKVITNREELAIVLERAKRIHIPSNLIRYWQLEKQELWDALQQQWNTVTLWSTVHDEEDNRLLASLRIPNLERVLISPIFPTPCKEGHPGIGVSRGETLLQQMKNHYPYVKGIALGGIHKNNYIECLNHTFNGVAIMSDFMKHVHCNI